MSEFIIKSQYLEVTIALLGAEVRKVINLATKHNYMWCANEQIWAGVSPTLFPVVGKTTNNQIKYNGNNYPLGNHGFARNSNFTIIEHGADKIHLRLTAAQIIQQYPFQLDFDIIYTISGKQLSTQYIIINRGDKTAYFSVGAHPAFACPFDDNHQLTDYYIEFDHNEPTLRHHEITPNAFFTGQTTEFKNSQIDLNEQTFINDAIILDNYHSSYIYLRERNSNRNIKVSLDGFNWLGIWSKINANYVCIEPWCGHSDYLGFDDCIDKKADIEKVSSLNTWNRAYTIEFNY